MRLVNLYDVDYLLFTSGATSVNILTSRMTFYHVQPKKSYLVLLILGWLDAA